MQRLGPHPRPTESAWAFSQAPRWLVGMLIFGKHWSQDYLGAYFPISGDCRLDFLSMAWREICISLEETLAQQDPCPARQLRSCEHIRLKLQSDSCVGP